MVRIEVARGDPGARILPQSRRSRAGAGDRHERRFRGGRQAPHSILCDSRSRRCWRTYPFS